MQIVRRLWVFVLLLPLLAATAGPGIWSPAGDIGTYRLNPQASLLLDGRVLVTGGQNGQDQLDTAQIFEAPSSWTPAASMANKRTFHTQTALFNGKVLVTGGMCIVPDPNIGSVLRILNSAELYTPSTNTWAPAASMNQTRNRHTATLLLDGRVLVAGGANLSILSSAEVYDPATDVWTPLPSMASTRLSPTATRLSSGKVLVTGGLTVAAELFDPATNSWSPTGSMLELRTEARATLLNDGRVLVVAGSSGTPEIYDPVTGTWAHTGPLASRVRPSLTLLKSGKALMAGGDGFTDDLVTLFDPSSGLWSADAPLLNPRSDHAAVRLADGRVLIVGGFPTAAELFSPDTTPPQISAPSSIVVEQSSPAGATVVIPVSAVDDTDGVVAVSNDAPPNFPPGKTTVHFTAFDAAGNVAHASTDVYVVDTTPPTISSLNASPENLWPPNSQYVPVTLAVTASDTVDSSPISTIDFVGSDETTAGDSPSWIITGALSVQLRSEKNKNGSTRTYTLVVRCTDASGNFSIRTVLVKVQKP